MSVLLLLPRRLRQKTVEPIAPNLWLLPIKLGTQCIFRLRWICPFTFVQSLFFVNKQLLANFFFARQYFEHYVLRTISFLVNISSRVFCFVDEFFLPVEYAFGKINWHSGNWIALTLSVRLSDKSRQQGYQCGSRQKSTSRGRVLQPCVIVYRSRQYKGKKVKI